MDIPIPAHDVGPQGNIVSRETTSLAYAEIAENNVQQFVQVHASGNSPDRPQSKPDMLGGQFRRFRMANGAQALRGFFQCMPVAHTCENGAFSARNTLARLPGQYF